MADNNNNRKSKRNFSLEKPVERRFDIEKEVDVTPVAPSKTAPSKPTTQNQPAGKSSQGRFDTSKDPVTKPGGNVPPTGPYGGNEGVNSSKKWIIIALIIAALAACAYFFMGDNKSGETTDPTQVLQNDSTQNDENANDSTANAANESEGNASNNGGNVVGDAIGADQNADNKYEGTSTPQTSEPKQSAPAAKNQPESNTVSNPSGVSSQAVSSASSSSIEQKAKDVWKGVYGNNPDRRKNLGSDYEEVQKLVNKMDRQGLN